MSNTPFSPGHLLRTCVRGLVRVYYPLVMVTGREKIPATGPVLLVANHANSLIDPVMLGIAAHRPVSFLAKAPLFDIPILGVILRSVGMLPAYRGMDDPTQIQRNLGSLNQAAEGLALGRAVGIFPEGKSHDSLKLAMIRSGAARIAIQTLTLGARALQIIPIGINYDRKEQFGSAVWIRVGDPIFPEQITLAEPDERRALRQLTNAIDRGLKRVVIQLTDESRARLLEPLEVIFPPQSSSPIERLLQRKRIADAMNHFITHDPPRAESIATQLAVHIRQLAAYNLAIDALILRQNQTAFILFLVSSTLSLAAGLLPAVIGSLFHLAPFVLVRFLAAKFQAPGNRTTISLHRLLLGLPIYGAWYALAFWFLKPFPWAITSTVLLALPFTGWLALHYWHWARLTWRTWLPQIQLLGKKSELQRLRHQQMHLQKQLRQLASEFSTLDPSD